MRCPESQPSILNITIIIIIIIIIILIVIIIIIIIIIIIVIIIIGIAIIICRMITLAEAQLLVDDGADPHIPAAWLSFGDVVRRSLLENSTPEILSPNLIL